MDKLFEKTYLGKPYQTRGGKKALFQAVHPCEMDTSKKEYSFFTEDCSFRVNEEGKMDFQVDDDVFAYHECHPELDIIGEWKISEEELDKLAYDKYPDYQLSYGEYESCEDLRDAYKTGFNKALEYVGGKG